MQGMQKWVVLHLQRHFDQQILQLHNFEDFMHYPAQLGSAVAQMFTNSTVKILRYEVHGQRKRLAKILVFC